MRTFLFFVFFVLACTSLQAQKSNNSEGRISVLISPEYTYKWFNVPSNHPAKEGLIKINKELKPQIGYRLGMGYDRLLNDKTRLGIGIYLTKLGYLRRVYADSLRWGVQNNGNGGFDPTIPSGENIANFTVHYNYVFLNVPISVRYYWKQKEKISFYTIGLFSPHILLKGNSLLNRLALSSSSSPNRINIALGVGLGMEYQINKETSLSVQPTFQYHLTPTVTAPVKEHLWELGMQVGCYFRL